MKGQHHYNTRVHWTGNRGTGTASYREYDRNYIVYVEGKPNILGSSDPAFRGDKTKYNPEELLLASLSSCHMLWYLHLCSEAGIIVTEYIDNAEGTMIETSNGGGRFNNVTLKPIVTVNDNSMVERANGLHKKASGLCFIANSVNFNVGHEPTCLCQ